MSTLVLSSVDSRRYGQFISEENSAISPSYFVTCYVAVVVFMCVQGSILLIRQVYMSVVSSIFKYAPPSSSLCVCICFDRSAGLIVCRLIGLYFTRFKDTCCTRLYHCVKQTSFDFTFICPSYSSCNTLVIGCFILWPHSDCIFRSPLRYHVLFFSPLRTSIKLDRSATFEPVEKQMKTHTRLRKERFLIVHEETMCTLFSGKRPYSK